MRSALAFLLLVTAGCGAPRPAPAIANTPAPGTPAAIVPDKEPANCTVEGSTTMRVAGAHAMVEVVSCDLGEKPYDDKDPGSPTVSTFEGYLKVTRGGKPVVREQIEEWENGWEWGASLALEGTLISTGARDTDAVLILHHQHSVDDSSVELVAYTVKDDALVRVGAWNKELMTITWNKASTAVHVRTCVLGDPALAHAGCGDRSDADPGPALALRWTGAAIEEKSAP